MKDLKQKVRMLLKKKMWLVLATVDENNIPYSSVMVYQSDGDLIICQTGENTLKANKVPIKKLVFDYIYRNYVPSKRVLLNSEELASLYHFPTPYLSWESA